MTTYNLTIPLNFSSQRLDKAISILLPDISRSQIQKSIKNNLVLINNVIISDYSRKVKENDEVFITIEEVETTQMLPAHIDIDIKYEDQDLIVINKPAGLTTHPGAGNYQDTLANALVYHSSSLSDIGGTFRPGIVHRLDKDTSGLMVVAKNNHAHVSLSEQLQKRELIRKYKALIWGVILPSKGTIEANIGRNRNDRTKMAVLKTSGKSARTHYNTIEIFARGLLSLIECRLETGRTHQIRLHLSHAGHSVVGDQTYGANIRKLKCCPEPLKSALEGLKRQALHSYYISFTHPVNGKQLEFSSELPKDLAEIIEIIPPIYN